jgi:hypothetical protein
MSVLGLVELPALHILHHDVEEIGVIVYLIYLDNVGMLKLR